VREALREVTKHGALAGNFGKPFFQKLLLSRSERTLLLKTLRAATHWQDAAALAAFGFLLEPFLKFPYEIVSALLTTSAASSSSSSSASSSSTRPSDAGADGQTRVQEDAAKSRWLSSSPSDDELLTPASRLPVVQPDYSKSYLHLFAVQVQECARIALAVYAADVLQMASIALGYRWCGSYPFSKVFAKSAYATWFASRLRLLTRHYSRRYVSRHPDAYGRVQIANRFVDLAIYVSLGVALLRVMRVDTGFLHGVLALGGVGTLTLGLASQGIAAQLLSGLALASSDRIYEGDQVRFNDDASEGTIVKLGWMETVLRGNDEVPYTVPNADFTKRRVSNLSRVRFCRVRQVLRFELTEVRKLPALFQSIKEEIQLACPDVVTDGSRPFRVHWTDYSSTTTAPADYYGISNNNNALEVVVEAHFRVKPVGDEYWDNRQNCLKAINRAVMINQVAFAGGSAGGGASSGASSSSMSSSR